MTPHNFLRVVLLLFVASVALGQQDAIDEGNALLAKKKYDQAVVKFEEVLDKDASNFDARLGLAEAYYQLGRFDAMLFNAVKAEKVKPEHLRAIELVGLAFRARGDAKRNGGDNPTGDYDQAAESFRKLTTLDAKNTSHYQQLGGCCYWLGRQSEAAAAFHSGFLVDKKKHHVFALWAAQSHGAGGQWSKALTTIDAALAEDPKNGDYLNYKATVLINMERKGQAADILLDALASGTVNVNVPAGQLRMCYVDAQGNVIDKDELERRYAMWTERSPKEPFAYWWLGYTQWQSEKFDAALNAFKKCDKLKGGNWPEAVFRMGTCYHGAKKYDDAAKTYHRAAKMNFSWNSEVESPRGKLGAVIGEVYGAGRFEDAIEMSEKYMIPITDQGGMASVLQNIGLFYRDWGESKVGRGGGPGKGKKYFEKSRDFYGRAYKEMSNAVGITDSKRAGWINDYGLMYQYYDLIDLKKAAKLYQEALTYDEFYDDALLNYARIHMRAERYAEAVELLERGSSRVDIQRALQRAKRQLADSQ